MNVLIPSNMFRDAAFIGRGDCGMVFSVNYEDRRAALKGNFVTKKHRHKGNACPREAKACSYKQYTVLEKLAGIQGIPLPLDYLDLSGTLSELGLLDAIQEVHPSTCDTILYELFLMQEIPSPETVSDRLRACLRPPPYFKDKLALLIERIHSRRIMLPTDFSWDNLLISNEDPWISDWTLAREKYFWRTDYLAQRALYHIEKDFDFLP